MRDTPETPAERFLHALFGTATANGAVIQLWTLHDKKSHYTRSWYGVSPYEGKLDVYVAAGLIPAPRGASHRGRSRDVVAIGGLWMDVDVNGGPEAKTRAAPDLDAARELCSAIADPTIIVNSGYGLQPWWLFQEPWILGGDTERDAAQGLVIAWQDAHRAAAGQAGYGLDATHDLARLMRLPGTYNGKGGLQAPVTTILEDGPRISPIEAQTLLVGRPRAAGRPGTTTTRPSMGAIVVGPDHDPPFERFAALMENSDVFARTWKHERKDRAAAGWSMSEYDLSLATQAVNAGWTEQEVADLLTAHRRRYDPGGDKGRRPDYIERTVQKARSDNRRQESAREREEAIEELTELAESGQPGDADRTFDLINILISSGCEATPEVAKLIQYGTDADLARLALILRDGTRLDLGDMDGLLNQRRFTKSLASQTGHLMDGVREPNWRAAVRVLLRHRELIVETEDTTWGELSEWLRVYLDRRGVPKRDDDVLAARLPFVEEGAVCVHVPTFSRFLKTALGVTASRSDALAAMRACGFERVAFNHGADNGRRTTVSYWRSTRKLDDE